MQKRAHYIHYIPYYILSSTYVSVSFLFSSSSFASPFRLHITYIFLCSKLLTRSKQFLFVVLLKFPIKIHHPCRVIRIIRHTFTFVLQWIHLVVIKIAKCLHSCYLSGGRDSSVKGLISCLRQRRDDAWNE